MKRLNDYLCSLLISEHVFTVTTKTRDITWAGTNGDVSMDVKGSKGSAAGIVLDNTARNDREKGQ